MSRKYCSNCTKPHQNGGLGMCDDCLEAEEVKRNDEEARLESLFENFMAQPEEDRWREIWEKMQ